MGDEITVVFTRQPAVRSVVFTAAVLQNGRLWPGSEVRSRRAILLYEPEREEHITLCLCLPLPTTPPHRSTVLLQHGGYDDRPPATKTPTSLSRPPPLSPPPTVKLTLNAVC